MDRWESKYIGEWSNKLYRQLIDKIVNVKRKDNKIILILSDENG